MTLPSPKGDLLRYLQEARDAVLWKLEGLGEYDARRPLTPTGTNLLGLVKHLAGVELGYFGDTFGRPFFHGDPPPWWYTRTDDPTADMWATAEESREEITRLYRAAWRHSDRTVEELDLDATGRVPWWPVERQEVTLHHVLVRITAETQRHAGHADILRELLDGSTGRSATDVLPGGADPDHWDEHRARLERAAREAAADDGPGPA